MLLIMIQKAIKKILKIQDAT
uniref:Uncharacterized protein n=1 Tax=Rhizophora mucronata TaxID=61149 RepID=A0A2P2PMD1_RHIMU